MHHGDEFGQDALHAADDELDRDRGENLFRPSFAFQGRQSRWISASARFTSS
jgi:hypothetical protein